MKLNDLMLLLRDGPLREGLWGPAVMPSDTLLPLPKRVNGLGEAESERWDDTGDTDCASAMPFSSTLPELIVAAAFSVETRSANEQKLSTRRSRVGLLWALPLVKVAASLSITVSPLPKGLVKREGACWGLPGMLTPPLVFSLLAVRRE